MTVEFKLIEKKVTFLKGKKAEMMATRHTYPNRNYMWLNRRKHLPSEQMTSFPFTINDIKDGLSDGRDGESLFTILVKGNFSQ